MKSFGEKIINFYGNLITPDVPSGIEVMNPYLEEDVMDVVQQFFNKYFPDEHPRRLIFGINPGRLGAGITGVGFTDPIRLEEICQIPNPFPRKRELSSDFIYHYLLEAYGGPELFYKDYFITSTYPLGFKENGKNINYYDRNDLQESLEDGILTHMQEQIDFGVHTDVAYCLGKGKNFKYLQKLNKTHAFFGEIKPLPHPRWVMQYRYHQRFDIATEMVEVLKNV